MSEKPASLLDYSIMHFFFFNAQLFLGIIISFNFITNSSAFQGIYTILVLTLFGLQAIVAVWYARQDTGYHTPLLAFVPSFLFLFIGLLQAIIGFILPSSFVLFWALFCFLGTYPLFMLLSNPGEPILYRGLLVALLIIVFLIPFLDLFLYQPSISFDDGVITELNPQLIDTYVFVVGILYSLYVFLLGGAFLYQLIYQQKHPRQKEQNVEILKG